MGLSGCLSRVQVFLGAGLVALLLGCSGPGEITGCDAADGVTPICSVSNPEDLVRVPGGQWLIAGEMPHPQAESPIQGRLVALRVKDNQQKVLFPGAKSAAAPTRGDPACPGPPSPARFAPHGLDLAKMESGGWVLAVVNHGEQERIDLFNVERVSGEPEVAWAGCVLVPPDMWPNDVVLRNDGSLYVSKMLPGALEDVGLSVAFRLLTGGDTGSVVRWTARDGWKKIENSHGSAPNGIAVSPNGGDVFFAEWGADRLVRLRRGADGKVTREWVDLGHHPDNVSWAPDGRLLVAGQVGTWSEMMACQSVDQGTCALPFSVIRVNPETLATEEILSHPGTAMGSVSSALVVGDRLYLGSFAADRLAYAPYTP